MALIGAVAGLSAAVAGQVAPILFKHAESFRSLRWTPPGAAAFLLVGESANDPVAYVAAFLTLECLCGCFDRCHLLDRASRGARSRWTAEDGKRQSKTDGYATGYSGWQLPFVSAELSAIVEKEMRYAMRNAQVRMMALMPLILIVVRARQLAKVEHWKAADVGRFFDLRLPD